MSLKESSLINKTILDLNWVQMEELKRLVPIYANSGSQSTHGNEELLRDLFSEDNKESEIIFIIEKNTSTYRDVSAMLIGLIIKIMFN